MGEKHHMVRTGEEGVGLGKGEDRGGGGGAWEG